MHQVTEKEVKKKKKKKNSIVTRRKCPASHYSSMSPGASQPFCRAGENARARKVIAFHRETRNTGAEKSY